MRLGTKVGAVYLAVGATLVSAHVVGQVGAHDAEFPAPARAASAHQPREAHLDPAHLRVLREPYGGCKEALQPGIPTVPPECRYMLRAR